MIDKYDRSHKDKYFETNMNKNKGPFEALSSGDTNSVIYWLKRYLRELCQRMPSIEMKEIMVGTISRISILALSKDISDINSNRHGVVFTEVIRNENMHSKFMRCKSTFVLSCHKIRIEQNATIRSVHIYPFLMKSRPSTISRDPDINILRYNGGRITNFLLHGIRCFTRTWGFKSKTDYETFIKLHSKLSIDSQL